MLSTGSGRRTHSHGIKTRTASLETRALAGMVVCALAA